MKFRALNVLIATDGSQYSRWAIEWLASLPFTPQPILRVLHVVDLDRRQAPCVVPASELAIRAEIKRMEASARQTQADAAALLHSLLLKGTVTVDRGSIPTVIAKHARRGIGLLAMGSRGDARLEPFGLGSVSDYELHHASCSLLIVKEAPRSMNQVLLAIDGAPDSRRSVRFLLRHLAPEPQGAAAQHIQITVVHVVPEDRLPGMWGASQQLIHRITDAIAQAGFPVQAIHRTGQPAEEILAVAKKEHPALIITGAKGLDTTGRLVLGSVSTHVVRHSTCSVLIAR